MDMGNKISVVVLTHNDELHIVDCLECLKFADEIIVVDDNSTDRTIELAKQFDVRVLAHPLNGNFANQRNFALNAVHNSWVLFVDSDEFIGEKLKNEIINVTKNAEFSGYFLKRVDIMWGQKILHGEVGEVNLLRLARKESGKWHGKVHETWKVRGKTGQLKNVLLHAPHPTVSEFVEEINTYSSLRATELGEAGTNTSFIEIVLFPVGKFVSNYLFKQGYKDGVPGFLYAMLMSFHSFLVRAKLYDSQNQS